MGERPDYELEAIGANQKDLFKLNDINLWDHRKELEKDLLREKSLQKKPILTTKELDEEVLRKIQILSGDVKLPDPTLEELTTRVLKMKLLHEPKIEGSTFEQVQQEMNMTETEMGMTEGAPGLLGEAVKDLGVNRLQELSGVETTIPKLPETERTDVALSLAETSAFHALERQKAEIQQQMLALTQSILETRGVNIALIVSPVQLAQDGKSMFFEVKNEEE